MGKGNGGCSTFLSSLTSLPLYQLYNNNVNHCEDMGIKEHYEMFLKSRI